MSLRISQASNLFTVNVFLMDTTPRAHQIFGGHVVLQGCHNALPLEIRVETRQKKTEIDCDYPHKYSPVVSTDIGSRLTYWNYSLGSTLLKQVSGRISLFRKLILEATNCNLRGMKAHVSSSPGSVLPIVCQASILIS